MPRDGPMTNRYLWNFDTSIHRYIDTFDAKSGSRLVYDTITASAAISSCAIALFLVFFDSLTFLKLFSINSFNAS